MRKYFLVILFFVVFLQFVNPDVLSRNSGVSTGMVINPDKYIEGFFFQENEAPVMSNVLLSSIPFGTNTTNENLTVTYSSSDEDGDALTNISDWRVGGVSIAVLNMPFDTKVNSITTGAVRDYSIYQNNGTLGGGTVSSMPAWNSSCKIGGCYNFDGVNDWISVSDDSSLDITNQLTISGWVNSNPSSNNLALVNKFSGGYSGYRFGASTTSMLFGFGNSTGGYEVFSKSGLSISGWSHVAMIKNGTSIKFYLNGQNVYSGTSKDEIINPNNAILQIGSNSWNAAWFNGSIDEVKIYNRALSPEQIRADYQAGLAGHSTETIVSQETEVGQTWQVAMTANDAWFDSETVLSNNLTIINNAPTNPNPRLVSVNGRNETDSNLNCSFDVLDVDSYTLNVTVNWIKNSSSQLNLTYNNIANNTFYSSLLDKNNLTLGDVWKCSVRYYDGYAYSNWVNSNNLTIIDITAPNITIISPQPINYTTLNVTFNVSLNENGSVCYYNLDISGNLSLTKLNNTYFWILNESLGPGYHNITFYCNDTSNNWGTNYTNFTIDNEAAIAILLSAELSWSVKWNVLSLPVDDLDAEGNNLNASTDYYINVSATNTLVDIYVKADGDLHAGLDTLALENENYTVSLNDSNVSGVAKITMTTNYSIIANGTGNNSVVYMKFYLDAPSSQAAGTYLNTLSFKAVRHGQSA